MVTNWDIHFRLNLFHGYNEIYQVHFSIFYKNVNSFIHSIKVHMGKKFIWTRATRLLLHFVEWNFFRRNIKRVRFCMSDDTRWDRYVRFVKCEGYYCWHSAFFCHVFQRLYLNNAHKHANVRRSNRRLLIYTKMLERLARRYLTARERERERTWPVVKTRVSSAGAKGSENSPFNPRGSTHPALLAFAFLTYEFISEN